MRVFFSISMRYNFGIFHFLNSLIDNIPHYRLKFGIHWYYHRLHTRHITRIQGRDVAVAVSLIDLSTHTHIKVTGSDTVYLFVQLSNGTSSGRTNYPSHNATVGLRCHLPPLHKAPVHKPTSTDYSLVKQAGKVPTCKPILSPPNNRVS